MKELKILVASVVAFGVTGISVCLASFSGSLTTDDGGLAGQGAWLTGTTLDWTVTPIAGGWKYYYKLTITNGGAISHMEIEVSDPFSLVGDFSNLNVTMGTIGNQSVQMWDHTNNSQDGMPEDFYGIKFDDVTGYILEFDFDSSRNPMWGDVFVQDGAAGNPTPNPIKSAVWNSGFTTSPDWDPIDPPADGSLYNHILVPDTTTRIPAPAAILLSSIGVGLVGWLRRRRAL